MRVYFDSSAFAKRYVGESGSARVLQWCDRTTALVLSVITVPELVSAFCRLRRESRLSTAQYERLKDELLAATSPDMQVAASSALWRHAGGITNWWGLKPAAAVLMGVPAGIIAGIVVSLVKPQRLADPGESEL